MTEPGLVSLLREFYTNMAQNFADPLLAVAGVSSLLSTLAQGSPFGLHDWYLSRKPQEEGLRKLLDEAGLQSWSNDDFFITTHLPSRRVRLGSLSKIVNKASEINNQQRLNKIPLHQVEPRYRPFAACLQDHPYQYALKELVATTQVREDIKGWEKMSVIANATVLHPYLTPFYIATAGMMAAVSYQAENYVADSWPHNLYAIGAIGSLATGIFAGFCALVMPPRVHPLVTSGRRALQYLGAGMLVAISCDYAHIKQYSFDFTEQNRKAATSHLIPNLSHPLFITYAEGKEVCQSMDEKDVSLCVIHQKGYFAPVNMFKIHPGGNVELVR